MKLGVICDGISRNLAHTVDVMDEFGLDYAELQFVGEKEVGDHDAGEIREINELLRDRGKPVSVLAGISLPARRLPTNQAMISIRSTWTR